VVIVSKLNNQLIIKGIPPWSAFLMQKNTEKEIKG